MSERIRNIMFVVMIGALAVAVTVLVAQNPTTQDRVAKLGASIMCPVCQGEAIIHSPSQMARDMMDLIRERVDEGVTDAQIVEELTNSYGSNILLDPPISGPTLILWMAPAIALVAGLGVIAWWRRHPTREAANVDTAARGRRAVGALILIGSAAAVVMAVGFFLQDRDELATGVANVDVDNLDEVSNETMEAVVAANLDHPQISGMRLALADRYREEGNYRSAFPHYFAVAEAETATAGQQVAALSGLAWITWDGNGEAETALGLLDRALEIQPGAVPVRFLEARILRCSDAIDRSEQVLSDLLAEPGLTDEWRSAVTDELTAVDAGEACA